MAFRASYDTTAKVISAAVSVLLLVIAFTTKGAIAPLLFIALIVLAYAWSPTGYEISGEAVVVRRPVGNVTIPLDGIREAKIASAGDLRGCIRLFGSGGLFGYYGLFRTSKLGMSRWYVTDRSRVVVLFGDFRTVLVSPEDVGGFIAAIGKSAPASLETGAARSGFGWIQAAIPIAVAGIVAVTILYSPGPPGYVLTKESLAIHDHFYPVTLSAANVDAVNVRVIDIDNDRDWRPILRMNGFASAHYHAGWFKVAGGGTVRMYRADGRRLVLLPPKGDGTPVLLETKDPEAFIGQIRQEWE